MKRVIGVLLVLAGVAPFAMAAKKVTVAQFEQAVTAFHTKPDAEAAFLAADMQLTERLSPARIARLNALLTGEKSRQALAAVADASEFQPPPPDELPATASPDLAGQRRIMGLTADYVSKAVPQLPNFMATRITDFYEDTPLLHLADGTVHYQPLHLMGHSTTAVLFRDGHEVEEKTKRAREAERGRGLHSYGEFGPILALILVDAAQNKLAFSRWEQGSRGLEAVFSYQVPKEKSHYYVDYCCVASEAATAAANTARFHELAGYHGEMSVDPEKGSILRIALIAELKNGSPVTRADLLVDYGLVEIGGKVYICPAKGVSITTAQMVQLDPRLGFPLARQLQPLKTMLNEVKFEDYHVFRAESRVLTAENEGAGTAPPEPAKPGTERLSQTAETSGEEQRADAAAKPEVPSAPAETPSVAQPPAAATTPATSVEDASPEISFADGAAIPDAPNQAPPPGAPSGFRMRTTTRLVDVGLVAYDKKGRPVTDLKQGHFEIYDNGRKQEIKYFGQASAVGAPVPSPAPAPAGQPTEIVYSNRQSATTHLPGNAAPESNTTIFLIDSSHVVFADLAYARSEMLRFLKTVPSDEPVGLYVFRKYGFEILREPTTDHSELAATLRKWMPSAQDFLQSQQEEMRNRQQMEYVARQYDLLAMNGNTPTGVGDLDAAPDPQRRSLGDHPERDALDYLVWVSRHVAAFRGHKSLIWVASDNVLADFSEKAPQEEKGDKYLEPLVLRAREALNEGQISIYPLDCSQLEANVVGANLQHANVQAKPTSTDFGIPGNGPDPAKGEAQQAFEKSKRDINPGRITAQMQQDTHPIQGTFRELAAATGGRALRRASDIAAELSSIVNEGRATYTLSFTPDSPADDKYHLITVKLTGRRDLKLRYRTGYLYEKEPATLKERFRQAMWQPRDVTDIAVTATREAAGKTASLKLNIAATDLEMAQAGDRWTDKLDIFLIEPDDTAQHAKFNGRTLALQLHSATYQNVLHYGIDVDQPVPARSDAGSFRIVVVDVNSGRMGSVTVPAAVQ
jgi:VWFA-related protein